MKPVLLTIAVLFAAPCFSSGSAMFRGDLQHSGVQGIGKMFSVGAILSSPVVVGDRIYFGSTDGYIYALG